MTWLDMDTAPTDGTVIEVLSNGDVLPVFWSESAQDGSPYGAEGWAHADERLMVVDTDGWRYPEDDRFIDEEGEKEERYQDYLDLLAAEKHAQNAISNQKRQATRKRNRAHAEKRYFNAFGVDISGQKMLLKDIYAAVIPIETKKRREEDAKILGSIFSMLW